MLKPLPVVSLILAIALGAGVESLAIGNKDEATDNQGLYATSDHVVILDVNNFKNIVHNSDRAWFVEFYNSWCGFCRRFAPTWKTFSKEVYGKYFFYLFIFFFYKR